MAEFIVASDILINPHRIDFVKVRGSAQDLILEVWFHGNAPGEPGLVVEGVAAEELMRILVRDFRLITGNAAEGEGSSQPARPAELT